MVVKNYRELCELLGEEIKTSDSKKAQLKRWSRYFLWDKNGHKYTIKEIYDNPLPVEDGRYNGNRSIYIPFIEWLLAEDLSKREGYTHTLTKRKWWDLLGIINKRYNRATHEEIIMFNEELHTEQEIKWFYNRSNSILNDILRSSLKSMKNRALIDYEEQTVIVRPNDEGGWFTAGDKELTKLQEIKRALFKKYGVSGENQVFLKDMQGEFYPEMYGIMKKKYGWDRYFKQIKIIFSPENIKKAMPELQDNLEKSELWTLIENNKLALNQEVVKRINRNAEKIFDKNIVDNYYGKTTYFLPANYRESQRSLCYYLVDWKSMEESNNIVNEKQYDTIEIDDLFFDLME